MPVPNPGDVLSKRDNNSLANPEKYPGKVSRNNKNGTLLNRDQWKRQEASKWVDAMKDNDRYDDTPNYQKAWLLQTWLQKTFPNISIKDSKTMLYDCEEERDKAEDEVTEISEVEDTEEECPSGEEHLIPDYPDSPDMFNNSSEEEMEVDNNLSRTEKERIIKAKIDSISIAMLENEENLPEFIKSSRCFKKKKEEFLDNYVDELFNMSSSQDIAVSFSQLPTFVREHQTVKSKLSQRKKEQLSTWRLQKNLNNTLKELQKDSSQEAYDERVMILAAAICPRYGVPQLDETRYVIEAAKKLK